MFWPMWLPMAQCCWHRDISNHNGTYKQHINIYPQGLRNGYFERSPQGSGSKRYEILLAFSYKSWRRLGRPYRSGAEATAAWRIAAPGFNVITRRVAGAIGRILSIAHSGAEGRTYGYGQVEKPWKMAEPLKKTCCWDKHSFGIPETCRFHFWMITSKLGCGFFVIGLFP